MSEGLTFSRPPNPIFKPSKRVSKRDHKALSKWNGWLLVQISAIYSMGAWSQSEPRNLLDQVQNIAGALDAGARLAVSPEVGPLYTRFADMPPVPLVWPDDYPFELAWHFLDYLQGLSGARTCPTAIARHP